MDKGEEYKFFCQGDLCQMAAQKNFLNSRGISTFQKDVYPCIKKSDLKTALELIYNHYVDGWWHYEDEYVKYGICTSEEFRKHFK